MPDRLQRRAKPRKHGKAARKARGRSAPPAPATNDGAIEIRHARFVHFILLGFSGTDAAREAGYSEKTARVQASALLTNPAISAEIARRRKELEKAVDVTVDTLVREHLSVALADPNDLIEIRRNCCRYCWGIGGAYQMTQRELDDRRAQYDRQVEKLEKEYKGRKDAKPSDQKPVIPGFDALGGAGFDKRKAPNPTCTECFGDGVEEVFVRDTRTLNTSARRLIRSVKRTKDGIEYRLADQHAARIEAGKLLGHYAGKGENAGPSLEDLIASAYTAGAKKGKAS